METRKGSKVSLWELARTFAVIGFTGFGGGMAVIALIQDACVDRKNWIDTEDFAHGVAFGQLLGSFAVNTSTFIGYKLRGLTGAMVCSLAFLSPSVLIVIALSAMYFHFHHIPAIQSALAGVAPVIIALIVYAAYQMGKGKMKNTESIVIILLAGLLSLIFLIQIILILVLTTLYGVIRYKVFHERIGE